MTVLKLVIVNVFLIIGMLYLPPLSGDTLPNAVSRAWLILGAFVFMGNYLAYREEVTIKHARKELQSLKARSQSVVTPERSLEYM